MKLYTAYTVLFILVTGHFKLDIFYTPLTRSKTYLDPDLDYSLDSDLDRVPDDVPVYTGHSLCNTTTRIALLFIVQSLLHRNPPNIWIKVN